MALTGFFMASQPKRDPVCGALSIAASFSSWLALYLFVRLHPDTSGPAGAAKLLLVQAFVPFCALGGLIFAIVALVRRERLWFLPLMTLCLALILLGLLCWIGGRAG